MRRTDPEQATAFARHDAARASERAILAARPSDPWIERDRATLSAHDDKPPAPHQWRGRKRGRPRKSAVG